ncbi:MAG TPA: hypothetical protein VMU97_01385 [Candidatus Dormibacteraeota bacterium]|nr:hypothetical protein [Candidatus Dormibacteraeota bacterium]
MNSKRTFYLMSGLILLFLAGIAASTYEVNGLLGRQSRTLVNAKAKLAALQQEQVELVQAKKDIAAYNDLYQISKVVVPENKNQAEAVRQIVNIASQNGVNLQSVSFPSSTLGGSKSASVAGVTANGPSAIGAGDPSLSQLRKVPNIPGVYVLELKVDGETVNLVGYPELIHFLAGLEQNRLTALVSDITITPDNQHGLFQFTLTLDIYIKPGGVS